MADDEVSVRFGAEIEELLGGVVRKKPRGAPGASRVTLQ
jgi:hypothetical protein